MDSFCEALPKIELHAHLNGSLSRSTLLKLARAKGDEASRASVDDFELAGEESLEKCFRVFAVAQALTDRPAAVKLATAETLREFREDNVVYVELRSTPRRTPHMTPSEYVGAMIEAIDETCPPIGLVARLLVSVDRRRSVGDIEEIVDVAVARRRERPDVVVGVDYSGDPSVGAFIDAVPCLDRARRAGLKIAVHAGEIPNDEEVLHVIEWRPDRLGHVTVLARADCSDEVRRAVTASKIPIELCLTSNVKSGTVDEYEQHHFKPLYESSYPITLATDDKGVFKTSLSREYAKCAKTFDLGREDLFNISKGSIEYIFAGEDTKNVLRSVLNDFGETLNKR